MKSLLFVLSATLILGAAALAQPDLKATPKAANPPNRNALNGGAKADKKALKAAFHERTAKHIELRLERLPKIVALLGIADDKTQEVIVGHFRTVMTAREPLLETQLDLRRALITKATSDTQFKAVIEAQRTARKAYEGAFQKALDDLDAKIAYRKTPRLEAVLLAIGALDPDGVNNTL